MFQGIGKLKNRGKATQSDDTVTLIAHTAWRTSNSLGKNCSAIPHSHRYVQYSTGVAYISAVYLSTRLILRPSLYFWLKKISED